MNNKLLTDYVKSTKNSKLVINTVKSDCSSCDNLPICSIHESMLAMREKISDEITTLNMSVYFQLDCQYYAGEWKRNDI